MLNDFSWNMTGYISIHQVNPHGDSIIPYVAERIFQLKPEPPAVGNLNDTDRFIDIKLPCREQMLRFCTGEEKWSVSSLTNYKMVRSMA